MGFALPCVVGLIHSVITRSNKKTLSSTRADSSPSRWYHQSQIKNDVLYIDGGIASFSERAPYSNVGRHITTTSVFVSSSLLQSP